MVNLFADWKYGRTIEKKVVSKKVLSNTNKKIRCDSTEDNNDPAAISRVIKMAFIINKPIFSWTSFTIFWLETKMYSLYPILANKSQKEAIVL